MRKKTINMPRAFIESLLLPGLMLAIGFYLNPKSPFFTEEAFPWMWLVPALIGLRYGLQFSLLSLAILIGGMFCTAYLLQINFQDYGVFILGGIILTLICGEFKDRWGKEFKQLLHKNAYCEQRLELLSREYNVLRYSHDRLEQSLISKPTTLREAMTRLKQFLAESKGILTVEIADRFLQLLSYYTALEKAALFLPQEGVMSITPFAQIGENKNLVLSDPLVQKCLSTKQSCYFAVNELAGASSSEYLVVAPLLSSDGQLLGILTVSDMPFLMLHQETLQTLNVLLIHFADEMWASKQAVYLQNDYPDCPASFAAELLKSHHLWRDIKIDSALVAFYLEAHPQREGLIFELLHSHRSLDRIWQTKHKQHEILIVLMPLASHSMVMGYLTRINKLFLKHHISIKENTPVDISYWQLSAYPDLTTLLSLVLKK